MKFKDAIRIVVEDRDPKKYPDGMTATEVLEELHARKDELGINPEWASVIDVADDLMEIYGRNR